MSSSRAGSKVKSYVESQVSSHVGSRGSSNGSSHMKSQVQGSETQFQDHAVWVKLPKINLQKFSGKVEHWQEFWDLFKSVIHDSPLLAKADKFNYLRSYLEGPVKKVIGGLSLTDADYDSAVQILKNRYARPAQIKRADMSQQINSPAVYNEKSITKL